MIFKSTLDALKYVALNKGSCLSFANPRRLPLFKCPLPHTINPADVDICPIYHICMLIP